MSFSCEKECIKSDEYEIQHYGISSTLFISKFQSSLNETIEQIFEHMRDSIISKMNLKETKVASLNNEINNVSILYKERAQKIIDTYKEDIRKYFAIPENVILKEDQTVTNVQNTELEPVLKDIDKLKREYLKEKTLLTLYEKELKTITQFQKIEGFHKLLEQITEIAKTGEELKKFENFELEHSKTIKALERQQRNKNISIHENKFDSTNEHEEDNE